MRQPILLNADWVQAVRHKPACAAWK